MTLLPNYLRQRASLYQLEKARKRSVTASAAKYSLLDFTLATMPDYEVNWHHRVLCDYLDRFVSGEIKRLMVFMPPRNGKSELVSRRLPAYILGRDPDAEIIATSYSAMLASKMNRDVQRIIDADEYRSIFPDTHLAGSKFQPVTNSTVYARNSETFEIVGHRGVYRSAGRGGGITGTGFNYGIIDDPLKDRLEANSATIRESLWDWYHSTFSTRQAPNASILITLTRWHEDDLAGRLLALAEGDPTADQWVVVSFPAIAEEPLGEDDPRQIGEPLWPQRYSLEHLAKVRAASAYEWNALYQQRPRPREGAMIKRHWLPIVEATPVEARRVRYWDKAGSEGGNGAATAGVLLAMTADGMTYVEHSITGHWSALEREVIIKETAEADSAKYGRGAVKIYVEQEPGSGGKESAESTVRNLRGHAIYKDRPTGDKNTRLEPFAAQAEGKNVRVQRGAWNEAYIEEMIAVPFGVRRDQADATAGAFNMLAERREISKGTAPGLLGNYRG